ncbi:MULTISPECIES: helix-turn-helix domain-containing protein [unclassified Rhizobium]|uniref:helix-turn-helix domain-containing protein n=1 Tax=unclassified Rhizobium TaxID=2613769 RepID=UPI001ADA80C6|nr:MULTISPECIES: helix-turn-helix domain-containing protein [unclassified Rhizobium]MBO9099985.1 helix-turn-helix domain-containing protein [Rhizobium sp. L58/93]QXZ82796.1 helix-turn-helix domain-containing protein [Rhizobium sp. K1/93]QXZ89691.1 helix-turn-helix domain-containing protein [Rhizobium sp. K15/93]
MSAEATIRRGVRNARYAAIPNHVFEDARLSMEARWLLSYLLSKPDNWTVVIGDIIKKGNCGRDKARNMIAELVKFGYAEREQQRDDGKFGSSVLVIFDEPKRSEDHESADQSESVAFLPQTDLPATALPAPVPPSPAKSAHSNNSSLANTDNQQERERASDVDGKKVEREFKAWYPTWPTYIGDSEDAARKEWLKLRVEDRAKCLDKTPAFVSAVKSTKGKFTYASVYLKGKAWEKLADPKSELATPSVHNPFSRAWSASRLAELLKAASTMMPVLSKFQQMELQAGGDRAEALMLDRLRNYGWPKVNTMHQRAANAQGVTVAPPMVAISETFVSLHRDSPQVARWKELHDRRGWPWLPIPKGVEWLFFPSGEPDEAIFEFERAISEGRSNDDAA